MNIADLQTANLVIEGCCGCPLPTCPGPEIDYRIRDAASGCGGYPPLIDGTPGAEKTLYRTVTEEDHKTQETSASDSYAGVPGEYFAWEGSMSDTYQRDQIFKDQISPISFQRDHAFFWFSCTGEDITECAGSYHVTYSYTGSSSTDLGDTFTRSIEYEYANQEIDGDCETVELVNTNTETGSIDRIPIPPSISLPGSPREDDVDTCTRTETTLEKIADHIVHDEAYDNYTGHSEYLFTKKWTYSEPVTKAELVAFVLAAMEDEDNPWITPTEVTHASFVMRWPTYPAEHASDPSSCELSSCETATCDATAVQYKMGIPLAWRDYTARHAQWVIDHAAWVTEHATWEDEDPETRGEAPVEPTEPEKRTTWKIQWDVVFFSDERQAWLDAKELHDAWEVEHQAWEDCTEDCGVEPPEPPEEGVEPTPPTFMEDDLFWEYTGLGNPEESHWYQLELLEGVDGQTRIVNIQYICWESERHGVKPTLYGEIYNHDDYVDGE